jgi:TonB family protein
VLFFNSLLINYDIYQNMPKIIYILLLTFWGLGCQVFAQNTGFDGEVHKMRKMDGSIQTQKDATYPGGLEQWIRDINHQIRPNHFANLSPTVSFVVTESGHIANARIVESSGNAQADEMALEIIQKMKKFQPAQSDNRPVAVQLRYKISLR